MEADTCLCDSVDCGMEHEVLTLRIEGEEEEDDDEEDDDDDDDEIDPDLINNTSSHFQKRRSLGSCLRSRPCTVCVYLAIVLLLLSSTVAVIVVAILVVSPYHKASEFVPSPCTAIQTVKDHADRRCSCGKGCHSQYPCIRIMVKIDSPDPDGESWTAVMAEDESVLRRQCTFYPSCKSSGNRNVKAVRQYAFEYGTPGHNYTCLYNPHHRQDVIRVKRFTLQHVAHGITWPLLTLILAIVSLAVTIRHRGCDFL